MSPEGLRAPLEFGRTRAHAARGALVLALLGCGAILALERLLTAPHTPVGELFRATRIHSSAILIVGCGCVLAIALYAFSRSVLMAPRFQITERGLQVHSTMGEYILEWRNMREVGVTAAGALGLKVNDRDAVLTTHSGTAQQQVWLRTAKPYGEWDYLFDPAEMGVSGQQACEWLAQHRPSSEDLNS